MSDPLLEQLGRLARAQAEADDPFERLALGRLTPDELEALEREARSNPDVALKLELFRPLGGAVVDRTLEVLSTSRPATPQQPPIATGSARRRWGLFVGATLALAASLWLIVRPAQVEWPAYSLAVTGEQTTRGSEPAPQVRLGAGSTLRLVARPATSVVGQVPAYAFVQREGQVQVWSAPIQRAPGGSVKIEGPVDLLLPDAPGKLTLVLVLGPRSAPSADTVQVWLSHSPPAGIQVLTSVVVRSAQ